MFDDGPEAVAWLVRQPSAVLIVDGYNVSKAAWPDLPAAEQRERLVASLDRLAVRSGARVDIVFDGADVTAPPRGGRGRDPVRVRFSDPGVEADDDVIALAGDQAPGAVVIVASSDNRVRDGAAACGANLVHARQLLDALRR
jgi:predicted RNA-binding protein with PIN domain